MPKVLNKRHNPNIEAVYIGRPSKWGNPFVSGRDGSRAEVIQKFEEWFLSQPELLAEARKELKGKHLLCWCAPKSCHGDVILRLVNENPFIKF